MLFHNALGDALNIKRTIAFHAESGGYEFVIGGAREESQAIDFQAILVWPWEKIPGGEQQRELIRTCLENWKAHFNGGKPSPRLPFYSAQTVVVISPQPQILTPISEGASA
jgi:hypothetical protein